LEPGNSQWQATLGLAYDTFGNLASQTLTGVGMSSRTTKLNWGSRGQLPVSLTNALSQTTQLAWDFASGSPTALTDPNGLTRSWSYDAWGQPTQETRPDQTQTSWARAVCASICDARTKYQLTQLEKDSLGATQGTAVIDIDQFGRAFRASARQPGGGMSVIGADTDPRGRIVRHYQPFWSGGNPGGYWQLDYDSLDLLATASLHSASGALDRTTGIRYDGLAVSRTDPLGHTSTESRTVWGDLVLVADAAGGNT
jgi:YD repeat-containing protein